MKTCSKCKIEQPLYSFHKNTQRKDGLNPQCKSCRKINRKEQYWKHYERNKEYGQRPDVKLRRLERDFARKYGITLEDYDRMLEEQDSKCAICFEEPKERLNVDHNHDTGKVRGLLCHTCNRSLGLLKDSTIVLKRAITYLEENDD